MFLAVVLTDVDFGLLIGIAFSLLTVVFRTQRFITIIITTEEGRLNLFHWETDGVYGSHSNDWL